MRITNPLDGIEAGQELDHYRIEEQIAEGPLTRTYRATDLRDGSTVAIKIPDPSIEADPLALERFHREEEIGTSFNHPDLMRIFHVSHRSRLYMVLEWCEGQSLSEILKQEGKLPPERAIRITIGILRALEYIHQHGVVHRDLKPEHIMVASDDRIKLIDFGVASQQGAKRLTFTSFGQVVGTPEYVSPEQVKGKRGDARSDLYATGIMFYEMLTGAPPFTGSSPMAVMNARLVRDPHSLQLPNFALAPQLQEVMRRATEREPRNRYASAHEFALDLEHLERVGITERAAPVAPSRQKSAIRPRILLYLAIALIPVVIFLVMMFVAGMH